MIKFSYIPAVLKTLSLRRCGNALLVFLNYIFLRLGIQIVFKTHPLTISLELSSICNLQCPECLCGLGKIHRQPLFMSPETAIDIINTHYRYAFIAQLFFQGEPMLNPQWFMIARHCRKNRLFTIINTNGHFLCNKNIDLLIKSDINRLIVSVDGTTAEVYNKYRKGGNLEKVIAGTKQLAALKKQRCKKNPEIVFQTLVNKYTYPQLKNYVSFARLNGADTIQKKSMQLYDLSPENLTFWQPKHPKYRRYPSKQKSERNNGCFRSLSVALYITNGTLVPCCFDKTANHNLDSFQQNAWFGVKRKLFLENLFMRKKSNPEMCHGCTEF